MLNTSRLSRVRGSQGTSAGGTYENPVTGARHYIKEPDSQRQGFNEVVASKLYDVMDFDAAVYQWTDDGRVATPFREGLPKRSDAADLRNSDEAQETFAPSAWLANFDVVGLVYENLLYDPARMERPCLLDFGGSFDRRATGGEKPFGDPYPPRELRALDGFLDPDLNQSAASVFGDMDEATFLDSRRRVTALTDGAIRAAVIGTPTGPDDDLNRAERVETMIQRKRVLASTDYADLF